MDTLNVKSLAKYEQLKMQRKGYFVITDTAGPTNCAIKWLISFTYR